MATVTNPIRDLPWQSSTSLAIGVMWLSTVNSISPETWSFGTGPSIYFVIANPKKDPTNVAEKEAFVIRRHPDFDSQTILVNDESDETDIVD
ncbi:predicted protein [Pyrenophora tritici-repentis Pt-1C-BFP]|uniref:Uncharacterized protein n=1 Tax=Pyrenophora tritici-repentis (strain Pt-1C-BFP) TaxID=426418 RepID=B2W4P9_PYRTR|nr:uncharacterized protein PTRG_04599 [Pyrenophora tritici-repentis Pt-1C-BFP]EDU47506.1 predicted protein [Pyrenophora tritici-repentis Pt-1C-BFP]